MITPRQVRCGANAGFTLVELMAVVAIVAVLATLAGVAYRRYIIAARSSEATYMVGQIRSAEESYRSETHQYLKVSDSWGSGVPADSDYFPTSPSATKTAWPDATCSAGFGCTHSDRQRWMQLAVRSDGPVGYGYCVTAGLAQSSAPPGGHPGVGFPTPTEPWYVIEAAGDADGDGRRSYVMGSSFSGDLMVVGEGL